MKAVVLVICSIFAILICQVGCNTSLRCKDVIGKTYVVRDNFWIINQFKNHDSLVLVNSQTLSTHEKEWLISHGEKTGDTIYDDLIDHAPLFVVVGQKLVFVEK